MHDARLGKPDRSLVTVDLNTKDREHTHTGFRYNRHNEFHHEVCSFRLPLGCRLCVRSGLAKGCVDDRPQRGIRE
jgi:hypothetical protein